MESGHKLKLHIGCYTANKGWKVLQAFAEAAETELMV